MMLEKKLQINLNTRDITPQWTTLAPHLVETLIKFEALVLAASQNLFLALTLWNLCYPTKFQNHVWQIFLELLPEIPYLSAMWILVILTLAIHVTFALLWLSEIQFLFIRDKSLLLCNCISLEVTPLRWLKYRSRLQIWNLHCPPDQNHRFHFSLRWDSQALKAQVPQPWAGRQIP